MKRTHLIASIAVAATALTALACGGGSTGTKSSVSGGKGSSVKTAAPEKTMTTAKIGQTVTLSDNTLGDKTQVDVTVSNGKQYSKEPGAYGSRPEHGVFLVLDVTVVCKKGTYSANPANFSFVAKDGAVSEEAFADFSPALDVTDLSAGQKASGKVVFDVSKSAVATGRIQIDGIGLDFDQPAAYWTL